MWPPVTPAPVTGAGGSARRRSVRTRRPRGRRPAARRRSRRAAIRSRPPGVLGRERDHAGGDATPLEGAARLRVDQERMIAAVGDDVDEADHDVVGRAGRYPAEAVRTDRVPPPGYGPPAV